MAAQIIASTYEIREELGSGGGGVVYSGEHIRLGKKVVLKADKRTPAAAPEVLRREVDTLKNLSHTYIPQVYDFIVEDGAVYTVMDFIEGESLDRPLARGERFSQAQVIVWAKQLLEALCYLHSRPPYGILHADIKPANIMLTPDGSIRLIDFNIALFLGEEGAVRVGYSQGYASPEHYSSSSGLIEDTKTELLTDRPAGRRSGRTYASAHRPGGVLDARSDIYSLGATLYHLLSGRRPAKNAGDVQPLTAGDGVSPAVAAIIQKAMSPDPAGRYQTAEEMLRAFTRLHLDDPRSKAHKRHVRMAAGVLTALFLAGGLCTFAGLKRMEQEQEREKIIAETAERALAAVTASESAYGSGDAPGAVRLALEALELDSPYIPQAQKALTDALGVYNLNDSFLPCRVLKLPSAPVKAALSPQGTRAAALVSGQALVFDTESGEQLASLPAETSALADVVFIGENTILYAGEGALRAYDLSAGTELWAGKPATSIALSGDGAAAAAVYKDENLAAVYDVRTGQTLRAVSFGEKSQRVLPNDVFFDPEDNLLALDNSGRYLAASFSNGGLEVFDLQNSGESVTVFDETEYTHFEGGFSGPYFVFSAQGDAESVFAVIDMEAMEQTGGFTSPDNTRYRVQADESGVFVANKDVLVEMTDTVTGEQREAAYVDRDQITGFSRSGGYIMTALESGSIAFFDGKAQLVESREAACDVLALAGDFALIGDRDTPNLRLLRLERRPETQVLTYDREYLHDEARLSGNGNVMLYRYDGFRLYAPDGSVLKEMELPDSAQVYDQQFRREESGDYLEVVYNDGTVRAYSAADGRLLSETPGTPPDNSLDEEFMTDGLRITAPLHGTPAAYDRETGELVRTLEKDDYLAYATQVGEYVVTEYITAQGERYGLLLDGNCETLARLPGLCDLLPDGTLLFDDMRGNLRQSRIYSLQELTALAKK